MIRTRTLALAVVGLLTIGSAAAAYAQSGGAGAGMMSMMDCPMMRGMAEGPAAVLELRDTLELTDEQVARLQSLRAAARERHTETMQQMREVHAVLDAAAGGESFDEAAVREAFNRMGELHADLGVGVLRAKHEALRLLNAQQRELLGQVRSSGMNMMDCMAMMGAGRMMHGMDDDADQARRDAAAPEREPR